MSQQQQQPIQPQQNSIQPQQYSTQPQQYSTQNNQQQVGPPKNISNDDLLMYIVCLWVAVASHDLDRSDIYIA